MPRAVMTSKGQVTIPKAVREKYGLKAGTPLDFEMSGERHFTVMPKTGSLKDLIGILKPYNRRRRPATIEEMQDAIETEAVARAMRSFKARR